MPTISAVIPCYNCAQTIERAVSSILEQSSAVQEIVLVDDCSTDTTREKLFELKELSPAIRVLTYERNKGPSAARNTGWEAARSDWIAFLDADDTWHRQKAHAVRLLIERHPEVRLFGHLVDVRSPAMDHEDTTFSDGEILEATAEVGKLSTKLRNPFSTPSAAVRRDVSLRFNEDLTRAEDYLLWSTLILSGTKCHKINLSLGSLYKARFGESGLSANVEKMREGERIALGKLAKSGMLGAIEYQLLKLFWYMKYLRRTRFWFGILA